jgi:hypothetical protein
MSAEGYVDVRLGWEDTDGEIELRRAGSLDGTLCTIPAELAADYDRLLPEWTVVQSKLRAHLARARQVERLEQEVQRHADALAQAQETLDKTRIEQVEP